MNTNTSKTVSAAKLAANRRNAQKSRGPRTAEGKEAAKMNARKHSLLARSVLVRGREFQESTVEFKALWSEFHASLAPVGPLEEMLLNQIVQAAWRLGRARMAESGEIALSVDEGCWNRMNQNPVPRILFQAKSPLAGSVALRLGRSAAGCAHLNFYLRQLKLAVEAAGGLTQAALDDYKESLGNDTDGIYWRLEAIRSKGPGPSGTETNEEVSKPARPAEQSQEAVRAAHTAEAIKIIDEELKLLQLKEADCDAREEAEELVRQAAAILPPATVLDRILRYETALERQLYRAMERLEKVQKARREKEEGSEILTEGHPGTRSEPGSVRVGGAIITEGHETKRWKLRNEPNFSAKKPMKEQI